MILARADGEGHLENPDKEDSPNFETIFEEINTLIGNFSNEFAIHNCSADAPISMIEGMAMSYESRILSYL